MRVTAVVNQKGGVGKTTTTINLGRALARLGRRVLLIDIDEQAALTFHFLGDAAEEMASLYEVIGSRPSATMAETIVMSDVPGIWVMPANDDLALLSNELVVAGVGRESRLAKELAKQTADYDDVLIDCPPSLNQLTVNALVAAHQVLIITEPELYSGRGVVKLLDTIDGVREQLNPLLAVAGVLINKYDSSIDIHVRRSVEIREQLTAGDPPITVMPTIVPRWTTVMRTTDAGADVADFNHPAARKLLGFYADIARTLLDPSVPVLEETVR
ncbi:chromosome partitioning protein [Jatrophihabitans sp. GAS493]|uniref:ParA family protein n=1 Tax=Jatrophihabitans sp. GAS493 TaxID=1907575 RepID=UPI000BB6EF99|nr:AAA family ATPase [Jatrophihabitans sp. GAS493]SOD72876.1 chromosome partitioning protein [Jatrophihabitans sp. GAS493]